MCDRVDAVVSFNRVRGLFQQPGDLFVLKFLLVLVVAWFTF